MKLFEETGLFYAKPIFKGSMNDAVNFPVGFESHIPAQLGLPPLPEGIFTCNLNLHTLNPIANDSSI